MATDRRRQILLAVIMVILGVVGFRAWKETSVAPSQTSNSKGAAAPGSGAGRQTGGRLETPDVHLDALGEDRPKPGPPERNLFRFRPKAAPVETRPAVRPPVNTAPAPPAGPPPPPPITLKFIGLIDRGAGQPKIAVLTDGVGPPMQGVEGGTVAGKYKILRIGAESIEMAYLDGRGRQTIRLSGS